jgi:ankyrin repeat protein
MPDPVKPLPAHPSLEQYRKQAKELARACDLRTLEALARVLRYHPRFAHLGTNDVQSVTLTDAQLVIAREHGFESWPKFAAHIATLNLQRSVAALADPVTAFIRAACVPRESHASGTLEEAELILAQYPQVRRANIHVAAILADEVSVRDFLAHDAANATAKGGPDGWDALTHLCFSRYLRVDRARSDAFVNTARALLDAGANANTGWIEMIDYPNPRPVIESAIYGAAGVAQHDGLTRLLLERGADPNDEETPYHAAEGYDLAALKVLLESGKLNSSSLTTLLLRKSDWHDTEGIRMLLVDGADPNAMTRWGYTALHQALHRDNRLVNIALFLDHGADPALKNIHDGRSAISMAARRGRGDVLLLLAERGFNLGLTGVESLIAACAKADDDAIGLIGAADPRLLEQLIAEGGTVLAEFAGNGNTKGVCALLNQGIPPDALYAGDPYFDIAPNSTALHVAAWHAWPGTVKLLIERGAPVNALDGKGRSALALAVKACVDSYWKNRRTPESVEALLSAGATIDGIEIPCGYDEVDELLSKAKGARRCLGC